MAIERNLLQSQVPGPNSQELLKAKQQYVARGVSHGTPLFIAEAHGARIKDMDGNEFIDFSSGIGTLNAGHTPPGVVEAIQKQAEKYLHTCFMVVMYEPYVSLAQKLTEITPGNFAKKSFLANSGAEAVENAIKFARAYTKRPGVVALESAFHGRTLMTMSLTSKVKPYKHGFGPFAPEIYKIPSAYCYRCSFGSSYPECGLHCLEHFERFFTAEVSPENIGAVIVEPVQGEGGFIVPPPEYLPGIAKICKEKGFVLIIDEIQTGFGRTGKMFAIEHFDVEPDLITMAKSLGSGLPISAVVGRAEIMDAPEPGQVGGTYSGNPLASAGALATLDYMKKEHLPERGAVIGQKIIDRFYEMKSKYPLIGDVRGLGAMVAMEMVTDQERKTPAKDAVKEIVQTCWEKGLIGLSAGIFSNVIRVLPPLVINDEDLETGLNILEEAVAQASSRYAAR